MTTPAGFVPTSTSWADVDHGWVLGFVPDSGTPRPVLLATGDGGATWTPRTAPEITVSPSSAQVRVHLANERDALATNGETIFATHDGARSWHLVELPDTGPRVDVGSIASNETNSYMMIASGSEEDQRTRLFSSPVDQTRWSPVPDVAVPVVVGGSVVASGSAAFAALSGPGVPGRFWSTEDGGAWRESAPPCPESDMASWLALVPRDRSAVYAVCAYRGELPTGHSYKDLKRSEAGGPFQLLGRAPTTGVMRGLAVPTSSSALVAAVGGGFAFLYRTTDGGRNWETVLRQEPPEFLDLAFQDAAHGVVFRGTGTGDTGAVLRTTDGGATWRELTFNSA
ncbi:Uncharacterized protein LX15_001037 [Streptoalloteichus tenebrarius]|uniref:Photosynthesis system II assembly factor Ycf48/Hcf136-like domain-containing protein n=1 Tax=Streptoalloteichus tenebrarius (strain ATCC 17920 / DSM 40477 / JCM 4838 / CBS 697.72 / NBRC 16177 / NCIMB 11028 / NRRL B-12390 / A12253. 1 / ISP 5477) TaxID=1933 RepID=A0ABT1HPB4_STRSD|nr:hypothetical protein [Streptoalloteichus tenebrarius]MCP2257352.1 Uncharacterized protein [Streptoalloteichus tenebrarius]